MLYEPVDGVAVTALGAALSAVPHIGGALTNILSGAWTKRKETRMREAFERVGSLLRLVDSSKVDWEYIRSEEFEGLVVLCLEHIVGEHRQDRRDLYAHILTNSVLRASPSAKTQAEWFAESLSRMSPYHMLAFKATRMAETDLEGFLRDVAAQPGALQALQALQACAGDLRSAGYVEFDTRLPVPTIISNLVALFTWARLTEVGKLFVAWITEPRGITQPETGAATR